MFPQNSVLFSQILDRLLLARVYPAGGCDQQKLDRIEPSRILATENSGSKARVGLVLTEFAAHGGCFPISLAGSGVIGSVAVSGLPQRVDHELVVEALCGELLCEYAELRLPDTVSD